MTGITVRPVSAEVLEEILPVYAYAREQMKRTGNPNQWGDDKPTAAELLREIRRGTLFRMDENGVLLGVFAFILGEDPTYRVIDGAWLSDAPYGTIHKVAKAPGARDFLTKVVDWCSRVCRNLRIDTHADNAVMQKAILKNGFTYCGVIYLADGSPRRAYQRVDAGV